MKYFELTFKVQPCTEDAIDVLAAMLAEVGCETFVPTEEGLLAYVQQNVLLQKTSRPDTKGIEAVISDFPFADIKITYCLKEAPDEDWNATWEASGIEPITIGTDLFIYDDRNENVVVPETKTVVKIRPCQAFGTGAHETTQMMLQQLLKMDLQNKTLIDAGCGTGILSIVGAKQGAIKVFAYDIDEWSARNAAENFARNDIPKSIYDIREGDAQVLAEAPQADVVVANIHRNIIMQDMLAFVEHLLPQGRLIISGFLAKDMEALTQKALSIGMAMEYHLSNKEWQCLCFVKNI